MAFRAILSNGHEPRAPARGGPNNVVDSKIGFPASGQKNIDRAYFYIALKAYSRLFMNKLH